MNFAEIVGPEPKWLDCACGAQSARVPCWSCAEVQRTRAAHTEARRLAEGTIPTRFGWARLAAPELASRVDSRRRPLAEVARAVLGADRVLLAGGSGAGKTSLAVACMRERLAADVRYVSAIRLGTARIQHAAGDGEPLVIDQALRARLLVLDDVGQEQNTSTNAVRDVIWQRHDASLSTWITTGLSLPELLTRYGDGARRRLVEEAYVEKLGPLQ